MNWNYFTFAKTHPGKVRPYNEDALLEMSEAGLWVVADGMGGHSAGDIASQMLVDRIARHIKDSKTTNIDELRTVVQQANKEIFDYAQAHLEAAGLRTVAGLLPDGSGRTALPPCPLPTGTRSGNPARCRESVR